LHVFREKVLSLADFLFILFINILLPEEVAPEWKNKDGFPESFGRQTVEKIKYSTIEILF
jgi:hypothetical protein